MARPREDGHTWRTTPTRPDESAFRDEDLLAGPYFGYQHMCDISATAEGRTISAECGDEVEFRDTDFGVVGGIGLRMPLAGIGTFVEATYALRVSEIDDTAK